MAFGLTFRIPRCIHFADSSGYPPTFPGSNVLGDGKNADEPALPSTLPVPVSFLFPRMIKTALIQGI